MQKLGAVKRNLFNTTVDRDELQKHAEQLDREGRQALRSYKRDSIIGVIHSATEDQPRKLKRLRSRLESSSDDESDDGSQRAVTTTELPSNDEASSSGDHSAQGSASKNANLELVPKGQKTIKRKPFSQSHPNLNAQHSIFILDYFPVIKRKR